jgi:hypothetical protein
MANAATLPTPPPGATDAQLVTPARANDQGSFFSASQIPDVWAKVTKNFPDALPAGVSFPKAPPAYFTPTTSEPTFYEQGSVDNYAVLYWRCAWLGASQAASSQRDTASAKRDADHLAEFASMPSVARDFNLSDYNAMITNTMKSSGLTSVQAELQLECGAVEMGAGK